MGEISQLLKLQSHWANTTWVILATPVARSEPLLLFRMFVPARSGGGGGSSNARGHLHLVLRGKGSGRGGLHALACGGERYAESKFERAQVRWSRGSWGGLKRNVDVVCMRAGVVMMVLEAFSANARAFPRTRASGAHAGQCVAAAACAVAYG